MTYDFSGLVAPGRPDLRRQLMRVATESRFLGESKGRKSFLNVERHESLARAILAQA